MRRRDLLAGIVFPAAGCLGVRCPNRQDVVSLLAVSEATGENAILLEYDTLGPRAQRALRRAASADDNYRQCHRDDGRSDIERLADQVDDEVGDRRGDLYLRYDGQYYDLEIGLIDVGVT